MAKSGSFYLDASSQETTYWTYMQGWVGWTESNVSAENNTSKVTVELQCHKSAGSKTTGTWAYSIYINGSCVVSSSWYGSIATDWVTIATASATVPHNADGSKTVSIYAKISGPGSTTMSGKSSSATGYAALTTIPRASTIGATDANIGSTSVIAVTKMTSGYTHTIAYAFGTQTGYLDADGAMVAAAVKMTTTSLSMAVPEAWYAEIPAAKSGVCTLTCITYSGDTQIGDAKTAAFTVTASEALCAPSVSGTVTDVNAATAALTGDSAKLIRYASTAKLAITATGKNSAAITEKTIAGQTVTDGTRTVAEVETNRFVFAATDSRGYSSQAVVTAEMVEYVRLTNNVTIKRTDATSGKAALSLKGTYFSGSFGAADNALSVKYRIKTKGGTFGEYASLSPTVSGNGYSFTGEIAGLEYTSEWVVEITVSDRLMSKTVDAAVGKGIPIANWGEDFWQFNVDVRMAGADGEAHTLLELTYPVGAIYISTVETSPASLFGGTWERIKDKFLLAAGDSYAAGDSGGEATHTLTVDEMPSHRHILYRPRWYNSDAPSYSTSIYGYTSGTTSTYYNDKNIEATGGDKEHNNMPPYLAVYVWKRIA